MQNQNQVIKNYILLSEPYILKELEDNNIKKCNKNYTIYLNVNFFDKMVVKYNRVFL